ncbi:MAG: hypothetical protein EAZ84_09695 [Verrucomicrobia bacterium]|nr:MAG: hypothetical protein EAZ84_09695 [Verrucomicrobiota bacterium]TAE86733.1 MAG: hypothetical protein EAZ82_10110 [Verrucomicrobiota bacterium]TAF24507.1 MAG: hypothetical protein EAZ71_10365 [Verrucomicrobiota bacterium]
MLTGAGKVGGVGCFGEKNLFFVFFLILAVAGLVAACSDFVGEYFLSRRAVALRLQKPLS